MVFGYALITDYPNIPLSGSMMLFGSILMMILTFETGRKLKNLKKWSWNSAMLLAFLTSFNIPFGSIFGINSLRTLQKSKHYFN